LFEIVEPLVDAAADAVEDCLGAALCPTPFPRFVSHGEPASVTRDYVAGYIVEIRPLATSRSANVGVKQIFKPRLVVSCIIRLVESGHPNLEISGSAVTLPTTEALNYAATHSYSHAQRALAAQIAVTDSVCKACSCDSLVLVTMRPDGPQGGATGLGTQVAWEWRWDATWG
jgi:hypothetical protein